MAARRKTFPSATVRKILAGHSNKKIGKSVDGLVYLNLTIFLKALMQDAEHKAREFGESKIAPRDIRKVTISTLRRFKG
jgi:histone H3/H4